MKPMGRATDRARRSGKLRASVFGTSSPMMIETSAMRSVTITKAIASADSVMKASCGGSSLIRLASPDEKATAPTAPDRKPRKVMAIWMVARNRPGSSTRRRAVRAARFPSSASWFRR